jgi:thioredoxin 1
MKRKTFIYTAIVVVLVAAITLSVLTRSEATPAKVDSKGITFIEQDWDKALTQAKAQKKLVFIDIYATWCGPCKMLKKNTFTDAKVGEFFNKNFVNVSIDGEKGVGPSLAQKYGITAYPSLIVTDGDGKPVLYTMGYIDAATLMQFAQAAMAKK